MEDLPKNNNFEQPLSKTTATDTITINAYAQKSGETIILGA